jgi:tRNA pseudouridine38-40 synthase
MPSRSIQLVLHYDGARFSGWQRQPVDRTVQGVLEKAVSRICDAPTNVTGAGRTDAGVHARGQAAGVVVSEKWRASELRRAINAILPEDVWVCSAFEMRNDFHPRYSAASRTYRYFVGTDELAASPFRSRTELSWRRPLDETLLAEAALPIEGNHCFRGFAVKGTAPETDDHRCTVRTARWLPRGGGLLFEIEADRFLHHMVRFLVGTMLDVGSGKRPPGDLSEILVSEDNATVSPPAPAHALFLERVEYPPELYLDHE